MEKKILPFLVLVVLMQCLVLVVQSSGSVKIDKTTKVSWVIDGDTFDTTSGDRIRLADVDAPEKGESGYYDAKNLLIGLVYGETVYLDIDDIYGTDKYGRLVCVVYVDYNSTHFKNVNKALLVAGVAVIKNYNNEFNPYTWTLYSPKEKPPPPSDSTPPSIFVLSPKNKTYAENNVPLTFTLGESTSWIGYSLDGQPNVTITGHTVLSELTNGLHSLIVYAKDKAGNIGSSEIVHFTIQTSPIDVTLPTISIVSPENKTYATSDIPLTFTVNEPVSWIAYSFDNEANVTITGNTTLFGLSDGSHSLIVYAEDLHGNLASEIIYFAIDTQKTEPQQADTFPSTSQLYMIVIVIVVIAGITGFVVYRKMKTFVEPSSPTKQHHYQTK
jgi:micrococcal nuclease